MAELGSLVLGVEPADRALSPPWCQSHPWARPHRTELAATGSLGTGTEAVKEDDTDHLDEHFRTQSIIFRTNQLHIPLIKTIAGSLQ